MSKYAGSPLFNLHMLLFSHVKLWQTWGNKKGIQAYLLFFSFSFSFFSLFFIFIFKLLVSYLKFIDASILCQNHILSSAKLYNMSNGFKLSQIEPIISDESHYKYNVIFCLSCIWVAVWGGVLMLFIRKMVCACFC